MTAASCYLFRDLPAENIKSIDDLSRSQDLAAGQWLFHKADIAEHIYLVETGAIELLMPVEPDIEVPVALIRPGNGCVGIGALLEPYTYTLSARAKEDSCLTVISRTDIFPLFRSDPALGRTVMANLAQRLLDRLVETREECRLHFLNLIQSVTFS